MICKLCTLSVYMAGAGITIGMCITCIAMVGVYFDVAWIPFMLIDVGLMIQICSGVILAISVTVLIIKIFGGSS